MKQRAERPAPVTSAAQPKPSKDSLEDLLRVEPLSIEVGISLVSFIADGANSPLLKRVGGIRRQLAGELGFIVLASNT